MIRCLKNIYHLVLAAFFHFFYGLPSRKLKVIGVTGTDGKTTTVSLIARILSTAGFKTAFISSVEARIGDKKLTTGLHTTTPNPQKLQRLLKMAVAQKVEYLVLEATSHGFDQHRLFGIKFLAGVLTNVTREHLDYHLTFDRYLAAKAKLFRNVKIAVLNRDDLSFAFLTSRLKKRRDCQIVSYGIKKKAAFTPRNFQFKTKLPGVYNQYNCLAAIALAKTLEISTKKILQAVAGFPGVEGRMQAIDEGQDFKVFVDFAHTPHALKSALKALRAIKPKNKQLIAVFGCAGLRDQGKRPKMGALACLLADKTILTAEDPRTEDVNQIIAQIAVGCRQNGGLEKKTFFCFPDRRQAIRAAIKMAKKGDLVAIFGKGHEQSMCFGRTEHPWSDEEEVCRALRQIKKNAAKK